MAHKDTEKILEIKNLKVIYKTDLETVEAVNGLELSIGKGKTLGLVGETGAGKTTTALSILRLLPAITGRILEGEIYFDGENLLEKNERYMQTVRGNRISMVFQDPMTSLNPVLTVGEQIAEAVQLHNPDMSKEQVNERVAFTLNMVGIMPSRSGEYPHQFSGGMKQRVVIAMALSCEPELLIADEPTTALDVTIQAQVLTMIRELRDRLGTSMLMITHDLGIVAQTCDDVAVMYSGIIIEAGTAEDIFLGDKHHPYTVGLFNSIPNLDVKSERLSPIAGLMPDPTNLPKGCVFAPRCEHRMDICLTARPEAYVNGTHKIACYLFTEQAGKQKAGVDQHAE
ncbi:ABC transporter ATP-binding protein [Acidaminobacter hydrogenoformans]|uniref:Peptide/nickel transport system ATP-binding protein n=1 Tax=Acidaminobacter hydrogenoformans DSM 2784 TaxID=1120920 RepID=A0A1G5RRY4_9FIRM|nr:ABC transporter ATP-binding protein [Acidaminobacter hydrogenoformans]SCZ76029.1 peptide/nickel transport system ATP-binding protein [Acidaminobacter hydrogenoformans DSM 2784]